MTNEAMIATTPSAGTHKCSRAEFTNYFLHHKLLFKDKCCKIGNQGRDFFKHKWLGDENMCLCNVTGWWWLIQNESKNLMYCLLCSHQFEDGEKYKELVVGANGVDRSDCIYVFIKLTMTRYQITMMDASNL